MVVSFTARAALLDMDGTLVDSHAVVHRVWSDWADSHGLDRETVLSVIPGRQGHASMAILLPERPHEVNLAENERLQAREIADVDGIVEIRGAAALLDALAGLPHALVTSADLALAGVRMTAAGLPMPPVAVTAEDVVQSKPNPEGFLTAAAALGVAPEDCVVFEDSAAGIAAGRAAGMRVVGIGAVSDEAEPTWTVPDLTGVRVTAAPEGMTFTLEQSV